MRYQTATGTWWDLTVRSVLARLLSGPEDTDVRTVCGRHAHVARFMFFARPHMTLPRNVRDTYGEAHTFFSWGYYQRMSGDVRPFEAMPRLRLECV